jgi:multicomponent Na+:H+ antiporter subunit E
LIKIYAGIGLFYAAVWLLLSGFFTPFLLILGVLSCALTLWLTQRMGLLDEDLPSLPMLLRFIAYLPWISREIAMANVDVIKRIINPSLPISPTLIRVPCSQKSDLGRVIYANSITLTPGTVAIQVENNYIEVHALSQQAAEELAGGAMDQRVSQLEDN